MSAHKIGDEPLAIGSRQVSKLPELFDWRAAARLTETNLEPIDQALTFTGLAAEIRESADSVGRLP